MFALQKNPRSRSALLPCIPASVCALLLTTLASGASAKVITIGFSGQITGVSEVEGSFPGGDLPDPFAIGQTFTGRFVFDTSFPDVAPAFTERDFDFNGDGNFETERNYRTRSRDFRVAIDTDPTGSGDYVAGYTTGEYNIFNDGIVATDPSGVPTVYLDSAAPFGRNYGAVPDDSGLFGDPVGGLELNQLALQHLQVTTDGSLPDLLSDSGFAPDAFFETLGGEVAYGLLMAYGDPLAGPIITGSVTLDWSSASNPRVATDGTVVTLSTGSPTSIESTLTTLPEGPDLFLNFDARFLDPGATLVVLLNGESITPEPITGNPGDGFSQVAIRVPDKFLGTEVQVTFLLDSTGGEAGVRLDLDNVKFTGGDPVAGFQFDNAMLELFPIVQNGDFSAPLEGSWEVASSGEGGAELRSVPLVGSLPLLGLGLGILAWRRRLPR